MVGYSINDSTQSWQVGLYRKAQASAWDGANGPPNGWTIVNRKAKNEQEKPGLTKNA